MNSDIRATLEALFMPQWRDDKLQVIKLTGSEPVRDLIRDRLTGRPFIYCLQDHYDFIEYYHQFIDMTFDELVDYITIHCALEV